MESILNTIKKMLGLEPDYDAFDVDVIVDINSAFMVLQQLGVGPKEGFMITGAEETWNQFIGDTKALNAVQTYVYLSTKLLFDPPTSSFVLTSMENQKTELGWRLHMQAEEGGLDGPVDVPSPPWGEGDEVGNPEDPGPVGPPDEGQEETKDPNPGPEDASGEGEAPNQNQEPAYFI